MDYHMKFQFVSFVFLELSDLTVASAAGDFLPVSLASFLNNSPMR
jgi:hypothetical protein